MTIQGLPPFTHETADHPAETNDSSAVTEVAQAALGDFALLNEDARWQIAQRLEIAELLTLSCTSSYWNGFCNDARIWRSIAIKIGCPLVEGIPPKAQVLLFVSDLIKATKAGKLTEDLKSIVNQAMTVEQIAHLHQSVLSRDILMVWFKLGKALNPEATLLDIFGDDDIGPFNSQQAIAKANGFHGWFIAHETELAALRYLSLSDCKLFHLPEELYLLTNLRRLNLEKNQLRHLPPEICSLTALTDLLLKGNPLRCTEGETLNLPPKLDITLEFLECLPYELNLQIAAQIGLPVDRMRENRWRTEMTLLSVLSQLPVGRQLPERIWALFYKPWRTISENRLMLEWKKARDTLTIWRHLAEKLTPNAPVEDHFDTVEAYIEKARQFPEWLENNRAALEGLPKKSVTLPGHIEIPEELKNHPALHQPISASELELNQRPRVIAFDRGVEQLTRPEQRNIQQYFVRATLMAIAAYMIYRLTNNWLH